MAEPNHGIDAALEEFVNRANKVAQKRSPSRNDIQGLEAALGRAQITHENFGALCEALERLNRYDTIAAVLGGNWLALPEDLRVAAMRRICNVDLPHGFTRPMGLACRIVDACWSDCLRLLSLAQNGLGKSSNRAKLAIAPMKRTWLRLADQDDRYPFESLRIDVENVPDLLWLIELLVESASRPASKKGLSKPEKTAQARLLRFLSQVAESPGLSEADRNALRRLDAASAARPATKAQTAPGGAPAQQSAPVLDKAATSPDQASVPGPCGAGPGESGRRPPEQVAALNRLQEAHRGLSDALAGFVGEVTRQNEAADHRIKSLVAQKEVLERELEAATSSAERVAQQQQELSRQKSELTASLRHRQAELERQTERLAQLEQECREQATALQEATRKIEELDRQRVEQREAAARQARRKMGEEIAGHLRPILEQFAEAQQREDTPRMASFYRSLLRNLHNSLVAKGVPLGE